MKLTSILNPEFVFINPPGRSRGEIYRHLVERMARHVSLPMSPAEITEGIIEREDTTRIPYEKGVAIPHLRAEFKDLYIGIAILDHPVKLKDNDSDPSEIIILSLISSQKTADIYLKAVSTFSRYLLNPLNAAKFAACRGADELFAVLDGDKVKVVPDITAEDIMTRDFASLTIDASVSEALDAFTRESKLALPVLDADGSLKGVIDAKAIIGGAVPQYIMLMDNLKFLTSFEPFEKLLKQETAMGVREFIRPPKLTMPPSTPLIQITVALVRDDGKNVFVVDNDGRLLGIISIQDIINKVLRG